MFAIAGSAAYLKTPSRRFPTLDRAVTAARAAMAGSFLPGDEVVVYEMRAARKVRRGRVARVAGVLDFVPAR